MYVLSFFLFSSFILASQMGGAPHYYNGVGHNSAMLDDQNYLFCCRYWTAHCCKNIILTGKVLIFNKVYRLMLPIVLCKAIELLWFNFNCSVLLPIGISLICSALTLDSFQSGIVNYDLSLSLSLFLFLSLSLCLFSCPKFYGFALVHHS